AVPYADWELSAHWPASYSPPPWHLQRWSRPLWDWSTDWPVQFRLPARASEPAALTWVTPPPPAGADFGAAHPQPWPPWPPPMATGALVLLGHFCSVVAVASADWSLYAHCPAPWTPPPEPPACVTD